MWNSPDLILKLVGPIGEVDFALKEVFGPSHADLTNVDAHQLCQLAETWNANR